MTQAKPIVRVASVQRAGRVIPRRPTGLRAAVVALRPGTAMDWHSTHAREELLIALSGRVHVEARSSSRRVQRALLKPGHCAFLKRQTLHRVVNRSTRHARYLYVTAPTR